MRGGQKWEGEVHGERNKTRWCEFRGVAFRKVFFGFYALLAKRFSLPIRHVQQRLFSYLRYKRFCVRFNAFCRAPFCLVIFYANHLYFQLFTKFFCVVLLCSQFFFLARRQRERQVARLISQSTSAGIKGILLWFANQQAFKLKVPSCGSPKCFSRRGEPAVIKRAMRPRINEV